MSCEFINTSTCPLSKAISILRSALGKTAEGFTAKDLRELVCNTDSDTTRREDCPIFQNRKGSGK